MEKRLRRVFPFILGIFILSLYSYISFGFSATFWQNSWVVGWIMLFISLISLFFLFNSKGTSFNFIILFSVLSQLLMFGLHSVHNDVYRYLWDGALVINGIHPFAYTPWQVAQPSLWYWDRLDFKHLYTIYPATSQIIFALGALIKEHMIFALRIIMLILSGGILLILNNLISNGNQKKWLMVFALSPVLIFDGIAGIHVEMVLTFFLMLSILLYKKEYYGWLGVALSATIFTKFYPLLLIPFFLRHREWKKTLISGVITSLILNVSFLLHPEYLINLIASIKRFYKQWVASPGLYNIVSWLFDSLLATKIIMLIILITVLIILWLQKTEPIKASFYIISTMLFTSSTVFSWYWLPVFALSIFVKDSVLKWTFLIPAFIFPLQYALIDSTTGVNNTFVYSQDGSVLWFQWLVWGPSVISFIWYLYKNYLLKIWQRKRKKMH